MAGNDKNDRGCKKEIEEVICLEQKASICTWGDRYM